MNIVVSLKGLNEKDAQECNVGDVAKITDTEYFDIFVWSDDRLLRLVTSCRNHL